uniref:Prominin-like protein n=1 Tax=Setaria digitata TaxID=48799 RepID=A0A915PVU9_9BILA
MGYCDLLKCNMTLLAYSTLILNCNVLMLRKMYDDLTSVITENITKTRLIPRCPRHEINLTQVDYSFGFMDPIYDFVQNICRQMQTTLDGTYKKKLSNLVLSTNEYFHPSDIRYLFLQQPWAVVLLLLSALYIILLPICGILFFCGPSICGTADSVSSSEVLEITEENKATKYLFASSLILITIFVGITLMLMIVYGESVDYFISRSDGVEKSMNSIYRDMNFLTIATANDLTCKFNRTLRKLIDGMNDTIQRLPNKTIRALRQGCLITTLPMVIKQFEVENVAEFFVDIMLAVESTKLLGSNLPKMVFQQSHMYNMIDTLKKIENRLGILLQIILTLKQSNNFIEAASERNNLIIHTVNQTIYNFNLTIQGGYQKISDLENLIGNPQIQVAAAAIYSSALVPVILVTVPSVTVVIYGVYFDRYRPEQQSNWRCAGIWSLLAAGAAFFTGWIIMLLASITFIGGFGVETICRLLFREEAHFYPPVHFTYNDKNHSASVGEFLNQCKNYKSILSALEMESFLQYHKQLYVKYLPNALQNAKWLITGHYFKSYLSEAQVHKFDDTFKEMIKLIEKLCKYTIPPSLIKYEELLNVSFVNTKHQMLKLLGTAKKMETNVIEVVRRSSNSANLTIVGQKAISYEYDLAIKDIYRRVMHAKYYLLSRSFICRPYYDSWLNLGSVFCEQFSRPIHGIWSSAGLIAICFLAIIAIVLCSSIFFFSLNNNFERRSRKVIL